MSNISNKTNKITTPFFQKSIVVIISIICMLLGLLVLVGWYSHTTELLQVLPMFVPMQYNTALGFLLSGLSLYLAIKRKFHLAIVAISIYGGIGLLTLTEYIFQLNIGIDEIFMKHYITVETTHAGRMAPNTALCFLLSAIAIQMTYGKNVLRMQISSILGALVFGFGIIAFIGYAVGMEITYGGGKLTRMAVHTSIGFILLGAGITTLNLSKEKFFSQDKSLAKDAGLIGYAFALALVIFFIDLSIPVEIAFGIPYILFVLFGWFIHREGITTVLAICSTILIIAELLYSIADIESPIVVVNRLFAILAVWLVARLLNRIKQNEKILNRTNIELDRNLAELQVKNNELAQFSYIASHDLQEPLRTVKNFTELFQEQYVHNIDKEGHIYLNFISQATTRMSDLIKGLLDYSRIGMNKQMTHINLQNILDDLQIDLYSTIHENEATVSIDKMPTIKGYKVEIGLLFQNLIVNAIKFKKPELKPEIKISAKNKRGFYEFSVQDNGIGIAPAHQKKIFSIFQRLHSRQEFEGTGIGLAHCKKIVELHEGTIIVNSTPNKGSKFIFTIKK